jgi:hypothetical protein
MLRKITTSLLVLIVIVGMAVAAEVKWGGYLRDDITVTDRHLGAVVGNYLGNYLRLRVDLKAYMNEHASLTATPEFTYLSGDRLLDPYTGLPLPSDHEVGLNRAQLDLWWERLQITLGKQRLQLSTAYFFSSLDIFNPADYTEPTVEREGVTAARMTAYWSGFSGERLIFVPKENWSSSPKAARTFVKVGGFEMGATYLEPGYDVIKTAGIDLAGPLGQLGVYLEAAGDVDNPEHRLDPRATLGLNWGWRGGPNFTLEYYHDERGATSMADYNYKNLFRGRQFTLGRDFAGETLMWQVHPLWVVGLASLVSLEDRSFFLNPSATWSLLDNVDLKLESDFYDGVKYSEFYFHNTLYRLQMMAYF